MANGHGGRRAGAGRPPGRKNTVIDGEDIQRISELARSHCETAIETLVHVMVAGKNDTARIAAAREILDRGIGKPLAGEPDNDKQPIIIPDGDARL